MAKLTNTQNKQRGQSLMEFALILTFLLLLIAGVVDLGRAFFTFVSLREAAQEGASYGSFCPYDKAGIEARVYATAEFSTSDINVTCQYVSTTGQTNLGNCVQTGPASGIGPGSGIKVGAVLPNFNITTPLVGTFIGQSFQIRAEVVDTILTTTCPTP